MRKLTLAAVLLAGTAFASLPARADTILQFSVMSDATAVPQSQSAPCIICATMVQQPLNFGFNNFVNTGNTDTATFWSTAQVGGSLGDGVLTGAVPYTAGQIITALADHIDFAVAIDVNSAEGGNPPTIMQLLSFDLFRVNADLTTIERLAHTDQTYSMMDIRPGNGKGDYLLTGFDLSGLQLGDRLLFRASFSGATDGPDSFYLVAGTTTVPPVPGPVVGTGLSGLIAAAFGMFGLRTWRRRRNGDTLPA